VRRRVRRRAPPDLRRCSVWEPAGAARRNDLGGDEPGSFGSPLFSLRYYEDGAALIDPFAEVAAYHENYKKEMIEKRKS
jgi:hypothetical protein